MRKNYIKKGLDIAMFISQRDAQKKNKLRENKFHGVVKNDNRVYNCTIFGGKKLGRTYTTPVAMKTFFFIFE